MNNPSKNLRVLINSLYNIIGNALTIIIAFFLTPFMISHLGKEAYGIWSTIGQIFSYSYLLNIGFSASMTRYGSMAATQNNHQYMNNLVSTATAFYGFGATIIVIFTLCFSPFFPNLFHISPEHSREGFITMLTVGLVTAATMFMGPQSGLLSGLQRFDITNGVRTGTFLARSILILIFLYLGFGLIAIAIIELIKQLLTNILFYVTTRKLLPHLRISRLHFQLNIFKEMFYYGLNTFVYVMGSTLLYQSSAIIIGLLLNPEMVAIYSIPVILLNLITQIITSATEVINPAAASEFSKGNYDQLKTYYLHSLRYSCLLLTPITIFLLSRGDDFIELWIGHDFALSAQLLPILLLAHIFHMTQRGTFQILAAANWHRFFGFITILTGITSIILSIILTYNLKLGLWGMAWGTFFPSVLLNGLGVFAYSLRKLRIKFYTALSESYIPCTLFSIPIVIFLWFSKQAFTKTCWLNFILEGLITLLIWLIVAWLFILNAQEKTSIKNGIHKCKGKLKWLPQRSL